MSVYFAEACGYIKIGYSNKPVERSITITRSGTRPDDIPFGADVDLVGWVPGDVWRERAFHLEHLVSRVVGEWFRLDREIVHDLIWRDPRGVDLHRMTASAVFASLRSPELTRAEIEAAGFQLLAPALDEHLVASVFSASKAAS